MKKYLLLFGLFILAAFNGFSQFQPINETGLQKIYVSTTGSDSGTGLIDSPYSSVKKALTEAMNIKKTGTGVKLIIAAGTYREGVPTDTYTWALYAETTNAPLVIEGAGWDASNPHNTGDVIISASENWSGGWTKNADGTWSKDWPYAWGVPARSTPPGRDKAVSDAFVRRELVHVNGQTFYQLNPPTGYTNINTFPGEAPLPANANGARLTSGEGAFWVTDAAGPTPGKITIKLPSSYSTSFNLNESGNLVEVTTKSGLLQVSCPATATTNSVIIRNLTFQHAAGSNPVLIMRQNNLLIEDCRFIKCHNSAMSVYGGNGGNQNILFRRVEWSGNGESGAVLSGLNNSLLSECKFNGNSRHAQIIAYPDWSACAAKLLYCINTIIYRTESNNNSVRGLWWDTRNVDCSIVESVSTGNTGSGYYMEDNNSVENNYEGMGTGTVGTGGIPNLGVRPTVKVIRCVSAHNRPLPAMLPYSSSLEGHGIRIAASENVYVEGSLIYDNEIQVSCHQDKRGEIRNVMFKNNVIASQALLKPLYSYAYNSPDGETLDAVNDNGVLVATIKGGWYSLFDGLSGSTNYNRYYYPSASAFFSRAQRQNNVTPALDLAGWRSAHLNNPNNGFADKAVDANSVLVNTAYDETKPLVAITTNTKFVAETDLASNVFTITRVSGVGYSSALTVNYTVRANTGDATNGTDFQPLPGTVIILANSRSADINITPVNDGITENNEPLVLVLDAAATNYVVTNPKDSVMLTDVKYTEIAVDGLTLNPGIVTLIKGLSQQLEATVNPANATDQKLNWSSSNPLAATVNTQGLVTGINCGTAVITVRNQNGDKVASSAINVISPAVTSINLSNSTLSLSTDMQSQLTATITPANVCGAMIWSSGNTGVASVNNSGKVTGISPGTTTITVSSPDGTKEASCIVTVSLSTNPVNLALNRPVTVSAYVIGYPGSNAVDGDKVNNASRWYEGVAVSVTPQWIEINLERNCSITGIATWTGAAGGYNQPNNDFQFQYWNGTTWITIFSETGNTLSVYSKNFTPVIANKVRLYITKVNNIYVRLYEIEVYGNSINDSSAPTVSSINRQTPTYDSTIATSVIFRITFSESVNGVDAGDFTLTTTNDAIGNIASVSSSTGTAIDITVSSIHGYGTIRLDLKASGTGITDAANNAISGGFSSGQTFTTLTAGTWTGATSTDWATATNWAGESVPASATDVIIPSGKMAVIGASTSAYCNNLTVTGSLTIQSSASGTGSLIVNGTSTGTVTAECYMTGSKWHVVSPIAEGQTVATFLTANSNIPTNGSSRGMMDYNTALNSWYSYYPTTGALGTMDAGKGYSARITTDGIVTFSGTLTSGTKHVALTKVSEDYSWNCIGNPYPSAIGINAYATSTENLIAKNSSILDASYACVYVWDEDALYSGQNCYKIISNTGFSLPSGKSLLVDYVVPGQGFFVKTAANNNTVQFTPAMQIHQIATVLKSASVSWPGFQLSVTSAQAKASTVITFNNGMTNGLDITYDAGLMRGTSGLELYSRLVDDNGVDFAIQCLPENYNSLVIPLGVESKTGGEITFSAETVELPAACSVILEDKLAKTFTSLAGGATYKTTVSAGTNAVGRFYIHTSNSTTGTSELPVGAFSLKAYTANGQIWIIGEVARGAQASLFDVNGRNLGTFNLQEGSRNSISATGLVTGVYLLNVTETGRTFNTKIVIY